MTTDTALRPDPAQLQSGDLIWPRRGDQIVTWRAGATPAQSPSAGRTAQTAAFEAQKHAFCAAAQRKTPELAEQVARWTLADFARFPPQPEAATSEASPPEQAHPPSIWVGHVGIVQRDAAGTLHVIDAMPGRERGVDSQTYETWLQAPDYDRAQANVWHGRLQGITPAQAGAVVDAARGLIGRDYAFFNFDMDDDAGFYCSKLVWAAFWRGMDLSLDGKPAQRRWWCSPYQLMQSPRVVLRFKPGDYRF